MEYLILPNEIPGNPGTNEECPMYENGTNACLHHCAVMSIRCDPPATAGYEPTDA